MPEHHGARRVSILFCATLAFAISTFVAKVGMAQSSDSGPSFEAATIKANPTGCCTSSKWSPDQVIFSNQMLKSLILFAYNLQPDQLTGPAWISSARFDITAKYPSGTKFAERLLMLRTLLQDRFKLTVHTGTKVMFAYELVVAKSGFKLKPSEPGEGSTSGGAPGPVRTLRARKIPISTLTYDLADSLGEVVLDETGLDGVYDFQLAWSSDDLSNGGGSDPNSVPSLFTALQDTLGLRLEHRKTEVPIVVVDHVIPVPAEN